MYVKSFAVNSRPLNSLTGGTEVGVKPSIPSVISRGAQSEVHPTFAAEIPKDIFLALTRLHAKTAASASSTRRLTRVLKTIHWVQRKWGFANRESRTTNCGRFCPALEEVSACISSSFI